MGLNIDQQLRTAKAQIKAGQPALARVTLLQALDVYPDNSRLLAGLADAQKLLTGLPVQGFDRPHMQHFLNTKARFGLGPAIEEIAAAVKLNPKHPWPKGILGGALIEAGLLPAAIIHLRAALKLDPKFKEAGLNLANALGQAGETEPALKVLDEVLKHSPDLPVALLMKAQFLTTLHRSAPALAVLDHYLALRPADVDAQIDRAELLRGVDEAKGKAALEAVLTAQPHNPKALVNLGNILLSEGDLTGAALRFESALASNPKSAIGFFNLGRARDFVPGEPVIAQMQALQGDPSLSGEERTVLQFGLAKALEDTGDIAGSFRHLQAGNDLRKAETGYDIAQDAALLRDLRARFAVGHGPSLPPDPDLPRRPLFVVGMMRSGTTLLEQMLSAHPQVLGAGELEVLPQAMAAVLPGSEGALSEDALLQIRAQYLAALAAFPGDARCVVDKLPANFRLIGLIRKALPEARILHMRRDPVAVCWSIYKTYFTQQNIGYAHSLQDTARYYDLYEAMMQDWRRDYPDGFMDVEYEALTRDPETTIRAVLDYCGLPFDAACLAPQENIRSVRTASVRQVRRGIYQGSSDKWRGFAPHLAPLTEHFGKTKG